MPRKKPSPQNPSCDEGYEEEILSDSSVESNSSSNLRRKKPKRRDSSKENRNNLLLQSMDKRTEKPQVYSSNKNEKRPPIIKIFRRIDRKAKHIYLVDDKIEGQNGDASLQPKDYSTIPNKVKSSNSLDWRNSEISLLNCCARRKSNTTSKKNPIKAAKAKRSKFIDVWNLPGKLDASKFPRSDINRTCNKMDIRNIPQDKNVSFSSETDFEPASNKIDVWNTHRDVDAIYPSVSDIALTPARSDSSGFSERYEDHPYFEDDAFTRQVRIDAISRELAALGNGYGKPSKAANSCSRNQSRIDANSTKSHALEWSFLCADASSQKFNSDIDFSGTGNEKIPSELNSSGTDDDQESVDLCIQQIKDFFEAGDV